MTQHMTDTEYQNFKADAAQGMSINALSKKYGITWPHAKALANGEAPELEPASEAPAEVEDAPAEYTISLDVPTMRLDDLLRGVPVEELVEAALAMPAQNKAELFQIVMQSRLNDALAPRTASAPMLVPASA